MNGRKLSAILFLSIIILISLTSLLFSKKQEKFPTEFLNQDYSDNLEHYMSTNLIFKKQISNLRTYIELISGKKEINGVYITKNYMLENFNYNIDINDKYINEKLIYMKDIAQNTNTPVNFMLIPSALEIYKDKSLNLAPIPNQKNIIDNIYKNTGGDISNIDVLTPLMSAKSKYIYYKTDSNLTSLGSYYCYNELMKNQNKTAIDINRFNIKYSSYDFYGSIYNKTLFEGFGADRIDLYYYPEIERNFEITKYNKNEIPKKYNDIFFKQELETQNKYNVFLGEKSLITKIKTNIKNGQKLIIFKDNFADSMVQFLVNQYEEIVLIDFENLNFDISKHINLSEFNQISFIFGIQNFIK